MNDIIEQIISLGDIYHGAVACCNESITTSHAINTFVSTYANLHDQILLIYDLLNETASFGTSAISSANPSP